MTVLRSGFLWAAELVLAFAIACLLVAYFGVQVSNIGESMSPTLESGDTVLVNKFAYRLSAPKAGDIIAFKPNGNENSHYYMKRVVAVPGDTIQIISGRVYVNGELAEEKVQTEKMEEAGVAEEPITLGSGEYFVLGDNRNASEDSRSADIGNVNEKDILGKVWFRLTPGSRFGFIE